MRRKLVKQGQKALTITLPIHWTREQHLQAGDEVDITITENDLLISTTDRKNDAKHKTIQSEGFSQSQLRSVIASAYKSGYTEIELRFTSPPAFLHEIVSTFTGLEIVSQTKSSIIVKSYVTIEEKDIDMLIVKLFQSVKVCAELVLTDWHKVNSEYLASILSGIRKLRDHCLRMINVTKYGGDMSYDYYELVTVMEKIAADFRTLAQYVIQAKPSEKALIKEVVGFVDTFYGCFLKKDIHISEEAWNSHNQRRQKQQSPSAVKKLGELSSFYYCLMERLQTLSSRILSISS